MGLRVGRQPRAPREQLHSPTPAPGGRVTRTPEPRCHALCRRAGRGCAPSPTPARSRRPGPDPRHGRHVPRGAPLTRSALAVGEGDAGGDSGWALRLRGNSLLRVYREDMVPLRRAPRGAFAALAQRPVAAAGSVWAGAGRRRRPPRVPAGGPRLSLRTLLLRLVPRRGRGLRSGDSGPRPGSVVGTDELGRGPCGGKRRWPPGTTASSQSWTALQWP